MRSLYQTLVLFTIIIVEGYIVLASELLTIRQTIPYVGSGTDTISIIIAAVLMPLAFGYHFGGKFKPRKVFGKFITIRKKLIVNIAISSTFLTFALSYVFIRIFFKWLPTIGYEDNISKTVIFCLIFIVVPVYLLGQTVPLISNYFSKEKLAQITGKILFFSTVGSFFGAVFSSVILMSTLGVHHTASLNFVLLTILVTLLQKRKMGIITLYMVSLTLFMLFINSDVIMNNRKIRKNNQYNTIQTVELNEKGRFLFVNENHSSHYKDDGSKYNYIEFAEKVGLESILLSTTQHNILVIGAGGFTFGHNDRNPTNQYTYVDIDKDLKDVAERYILKEPIGDNKSFVPKPARAFLTETDKKYDLIYLDAYKGGVSIPEQLVTQEFYEQIKSHLKDKGILITNFILSPNFNNALSRNLDNTFRSVFPHVSRYIINGNYHLWTDSKTLSINVAYLYRHEDDYDYGHIYTDNKNTVFYDKPKKLTP